MSECLIQRDVMVPMRDGVCLATDVYRPSWPGRFPALLHRIPYGRSSEALVNGLVFSPEDAANRGFVVAVQDVRGTGSSGGRFRPIVQERDDGLDMIRWAEEQPWCSNGSLGTYGSSYMGVTALQPAIDGPDSLKAVFAYLTGSNYHDGWIYSGGAFELAFCVRWTMARISESLERGDVRSATADSCQALLSDFQVDPAAFLRRCSDVRELMLPVREAAPYFFDWLDHPDYDEYWRSIDVAASASRIRAPVLHVGGWYDGFLNGHLALQRGLAESASGQQSPHRFVVGPWSHESYLKAETASSAGLREFGAEARGGREGIGNLALSWFRRWLLQADIPDLPMTRYFLMGDNRWVDGSCWPPRSEAQVWFLRSNGGANGRSGDGRLSLVAPVSEPPDVIRYDPRCPSPTAGGRHLGDPVLPAGVRDQAPAEDRDDVAVYTSETLAASVTVAGRVTVKVYAQFSTAGADICATLVDVNEMDEAHNVADGVARVRRATLQHPDGDGGVEIDLLHTAYTFGREHRIRLDVASSNFPRIDLNPAARMTEDNDGSAVSERRILHDRDHASALSLSVVSVEEL